VCTTNDGLDAVLQTATPAQRRSLVLVQNGMLLPWLRAHGLQHSVTQALLYMSGESPLQQGAVGVKPHARSGANLQVPLSTQY
jgi:hypothetical protein